MRVFLRSVLFMTLSAALASPAGAQARGAAAQAPQAESAQDIPALAARIGAVRLHYTSSRLSAAREQLSSTLNPVRSGAGGRGREGGPPGRRAASARRQGGAHAGPAQARGARVSD